MTTPASAIRRLDHSVQYVGKRKPKSKRVISWSFSLSGTRHDVALTWSISSGKCDVTLDGTNVHFSRRKGASIFQAKLDALHPGAGIPELHLICTRTAPLGSPVGFRQYELLLDDKSFFSFPDERGDVLGDENDSDRPMSIVELLYPDGVKGGSKAEETLPPPGLDFAEGGGTRDSLELSDDSSDEGGSAVDSQARYTSGGGRTVEADLFGGGRGNEVSSVESTGARGGDSLGAGGAALVQTEMSGDRVANDHGVTAAGATGGGVLVAADLISDPYAHGTLDHPTTAAVTDPGVVASSSAPAGAYASVDALFGATQSTTVAAVPPTRTGNQTLPLMEEKKLVKEENPVTNIVDPFSSFDLLPQP